MAIPAAVPIIGAVASGISSLGSLFNRSPSGLNFPAQTDFAAILAGLNNQKKEPETDNSTLIFLGIGIIAVILFTQKK